MNTSLTIGDIIIRCGKVHEIIDVNMRKRNDIEEKVIKYQAFYKAKNDFNLTYTTPSKSLSIHNIRRPISKQEYQDLIKQLSTIPQKPIVIDTKKVGDKLNLNDPFQTVDIIQALWTEKQTSPEGFNNTKQQILDQALKYLTQEVAYVGDISCEDAASLIEKTLQTSHSIIKN